MSQQTKKILKIFLWKMLLIYKTLKIYPAVSQIMKLIKPWIVFEVDSIELSTPDLFSDNDELGSYNQDLSNKK